MSDLYSENKDFENYDYEGLAEKITSEKQIFRKFKSKSVAAKEWIRDLIENGYKAAGGRVRNATVGLYMSDEKQDVGVLSIAPSLSALLYELSLLKSKETILQNKDADDQADDEMSFGEILTDNKLLTKNKLTVLNVVTASICHLLEECYPYGIDHAVELSSKPFYDEGESQGEWSVNGGWKKNGYLDSASWVFLAAESIEKFLKRLEETLPDVYKKIEWNVKYTTYDGEQKVQNLSTDKVKAVIRELYIYCLRVTCNCIVIRDNKALGWSFKDMDDNNTDPSLYFSYVASTVYLGLFKRFDRDDETIKKLREFEKSICENSGGDDIKNFKFYENFSSQEALVKTVEWINKHKKDGVNDAANLEGLLKSKNEADNKILDEKLKELDFLYNEINNGQPLTYRINNSIDSCKDRNSKQYRDSSFTALKESTIEVAKALWSEGFGTSVARVPFKKNMAEGPCFENGTLVNMDIVRMSSHSNAFFNNLFVIGIILNSGYDIELRNTDFEEYNRMYNVFQISIQNTQRCYSELEREELLYKVDSYILDFSEKVDDDNKELAKQLRRVNIAAVPLLPLMLKNNNLMSEYVVKYPQKQMTDSLQDILRNKKSVKKKDQTEKFWVWDKDGFNAITNYYYIDALISFYRYYEKFEAPFINSEKREIEIRSKAIEESKAIAEAALRANDNKYKKELEWRDAYIDQTRELGKGIARFVVNGLIELVDEQITAEKLLAGLDSGERKQRNTIIEQLNSFDKDTDIVKISTLVHLLEKLQLLSLLTMNNNSEIPALLKKGNPDDEKDTPGVIIRKVFGDNGDSAKFMMNLIAALASQVVGSKHDNNQ